jgi:hypothetical protein
MESHKVLASENKAAKKKSKFGHNHIKLLPLKQVKNVRSLHLWMDPVTQHKGEQMVET